MFNKWTPDFGTLLANPKMGLTEDFVAGKLATDRRSAHVRHLSAQGVPPVSKVSLVPCGQLHGWHSQI